MRKLNQRNVWSLPDPVFNDVRVSKFVNHLMYDGKRTPHTQFSIPHWRL